MLVEQQTCRKTRKFWDNASEYKYHADIHDSIPELSLCFFTVFSFALLFWIILSFLQDHFVYQDERRNY